MIRTRLGGDPRLLPFFVAGWRLGLGPLLGRPFCLVTASSDPDRIERVALPYVFASGDLFVPAIGDVRWTAAARAKPQVMVQAHPGPLSTRARPLDATEVRSLIDELHGNDPELARLDDVDWWVLSPTGDPAPPPALPDLNWVLPVVGLAVVVLRRFRGSGH